VVVAISIDGEYCFSKIPRLSITLTRGYVIEADAHYGPLVRHRYLARRNPKAPNLRQVHLIPNELFVPPGLSDSMCAGDFGENIATVGLDFEYMPLGTLRLGASATLELTGLPPIRHHNRNRNRSANRPAAQDRCGRPLRRPYYSLGLGINLPFLISWLTVCRRPAWTAR
jgi:hypothetical protein